MKNIIHSACIPALLALLTACGNPNQRLDEHVFYDGPQIQLKVVRYYRNIPFNQLGEHAVVMCRSENTAAFPADEQQDAGWRMLGAGDAHGSKTAEEAALEVKDDYEVLDEHILVAKMNVFNISFDACGHFTNWDPSRLPQSLINPLKKPDSCAPNGPADCRYYDFEGERAPRYENIRVTGDGQVSFTASTPTFRDVELLRVQTGNNGGVWHVETIGTDKRQVDPATLRALPVSLLESGTGNSSLAEWFESVLPPRSMVVWPETLTDCGKQSCAAIRFNDSKGNGGTLEIALDTAPEGKPGPASFHSGSYRSGEQARPVDSLTDLRKILSDSAK
ncbi:MAG TPA: hypothetical protein ENJ80_12205 [Gammaproteobacteria bacterium]|nr:hypothetical protein [Gammaproteobacteria bacterium]